MKKLRLDDLAVDSFETTRLPAVQRGTVRAHSAGAGPMDTCFAVNTLCGYQCGTGTDCEPQGTRNGVTCNVTCYKGATDCGTCAPAASCDLQYGCSGTSFDLQPC